MFRNATLAILLVAAALVAPITTANAAVQSDASVQAAQGSEDNVGRLYAWATTRARLHQLIGFANAKGFVTVGRIQWGYVPEAGGNAYWVYLAYFGS